MTLHAYDHYLKEVLIDSPTLQARIREMGDLISRDYATSQRLLLLCVLKGGVMFLTDLMRHISVPHEIHFMAVSSYGKGVRSSSGAVQIVMDLSTHIEGSDVIIVEDIIDSGRTLKYLADSLQLRHPASLRICTLLDKPSRRVVEVEVAYTGFVIEDKFVFGYGLDLDERFRNLPFVGVVKPESLTE
jgi:hypoxanthine phosphoribosyltransferase